MENQEGTKKKFYKKWWFWGIVVIVLFIIGSASGSSSQNSASSTASSQPAAEAPKPIVVTAAKLFADYQANEVSADTMYKNKTVQVSGTIGTIGKDITDTPYVTLNVGGQYEISNVQCTFSNNDTAALSALSKGQKVTLQGEVSGKLGNVLINSCQLVQ